MIDSKREFIDLVNIIRYKAMRDHIVDFIKRSGARKNQKMLSNFESIFGKLSSSYTTFSLNSDELWILLDKVRENYRLEIIYFMIFVQIFQKVSNN